MGISHEYPPICLETAQQAENRPLLLLVSHGHSGKWRKVERGCPAKSGGVGNMHMTSWLRCPCREIGGSRQTVYGTVGEGSGTADAAAVTPLGSRSSSPAQAANIRLAVTRRMIKVARSVSPAVGRRGLSYFSMRSGRQPDRAFPIIERSTCGVPICGYTAWGPDAIRNRSARWSEQRARPRGGKWMC